MFSKSKTPSNGASPAAGKPRGAFSVLGFDVVVAGDVTATADLHIDGEVQGDIRCASLVLGETSRVTGGIVAENARLAGAVDGSIEARELVIERTARVSGDVTYETITIEPGGHVAGRLIPRGGTQVLDEPVTKTLQLIATAAE